MALPAFAAVRRAVAWLLLTAGRVAMDRYLLAAGPTAANPQQRPDGRDRRRTDTRPLHSLCSMYYAGSVNNMQVFSVAPVHRGL